MYQLLLPVYVEQAAPAVRASVLRPYVEAGPDCHDSWEDGKDSGVNQLTLGAHQVGTWCEDA